MRGGPGKEDQTDEVGHDRQDIDYPQELQRIVAKANDAPVLRILAGAIHPQRVFHREHDERKELEQTQKRVSPPIRIDDRIGQAELVDERVPRVSVAAGIGSGVVSHVYILSKHVDLCALWPV